ncbi:MAG: endonuclease domain-containing protein [Leucobacter sp.]
MSVVAHLRSLDGVGLSTALFARGYSRHTIAKAVERGQVIRPRKGWVALREADPELIAAARRGVLLSCITQARRLGLWVLEEQEPHLAARSPNAHLKPGNGIVHWTTPVKPRAPEALVDSIENVIALVAQCRPQEEAKATIESALNKRLIDMQQLEALPYSAAIRDVLATVTPFSDSGLETYVKERLRWFRMPVKAQAWLYGHRVDFLIGKRLVLQIDGGHHIGPQRNSDNRHDAELMLRGYRVIRVSYRDVIHAWPETQDLIMSAIAQGAHLSA